MGTRDERGEWFRPGGGPGHVTVEAGAPPWILGHRGAPREAPENTLVSLRRALDWGLDGVEYDVRACATGEPILIHDETLERTTNGHGTVAELTLPELAGIDAGGWFHKSFVGEPLPLLEEALDLSADDDRRPMHMIELKEPGLVGEVARELAQLPRPLPVRVASFDRGVCLAARDAGLATMLLAVEADEDDRSFVRDERLAAHGTGPGGWDTEAGRAEWSCERWGWSIDAPGELLVACRSPLFGFNTNEPRRALAVRALVSLTPDDEGGYPLEVPRIEVPARLADSAGGGEWRGRWSVEVGLRNPFPFEVEVATTLAVRGGAFEVEGLPARGTLAPGERRGVDLRLAGGSWSPGEDPVLLARFVWQAGAGRAAGELLLDAPLERTRSLTLREDVLRLWMLRERPSDPEASMTVRRRGSEVLARIEESGGLEDVRALVRLGTRTRAGGRGVRAPLPPDFGQRPGGVPFSVGFEGRLGGERRIRRWAGGLPTGLGSGAPGRLFGGKG